jgi:hypothetical protein
MAFAIFWAAVIFGAAAFGVADCDGIGCWAYKADDAREATAARVSTAYLAMARLSSNGKGARRT